MNLILLEKSRTWSDTIGRMAKSTGSKLIECRSRDEFQSATTSSNALIALLGFTGRESTVQVIELLHFIEKLSRNQPQIATVLLLPSNYLHLEGLAWETGADFVQVGTREISNLSRLIQQATKRFTTEDPPPSDMRAAILQRLPW